MKKKTLPKKLVIKRSKWGTGALLGNDCIGQRGKMCCLGFLAAQGFKPNDVRGESMPSDLAHKCDSVSKVANVAKLFPKLLRRDGSDTDLANKLAEVNDDKLPHESFCGLLGS